MKNALCPLWLLAGAPCLTGCNHNIFTAPVAVETPGMPSPELALQKSIDRVHTFMTSLNERLETPAMTTRPPAISPDQTSGSPAKELASEPCNGTGLGTVILDGPKEDLFALTNDDDIMAS